MKSGRKAFLREFVTFFLPPGVNLLGVSISLRSSLTSQNKERKLPDQGGRGACGGGGRLRLRRSRAGSTLAAERRARDSEAGGGRGRRGAWFAAFRAPRSGARSAASQAFGWTEKASGRTSKGRDRGSKASGAPTWASPSPRPRRARSG